MYFKLNMYQSLFCLVITRCTALYGVPTMFIDMLNHPSFSDYDLSTLYTGIMGGSPCPVDTMRQVINKMNMENITVCIDFAFLWQRWVIRLIIGMSFSFIDFIDA